MRRQRGVRAAKHFKRKVWNLRHDVGDRWLETRRRFVRDVAAQINQRLTDGQLGGQLGNWEVTNPSPLTPARTAATGAGSFR